MNKELFNVAKFNKPKRNLFDLSHERKLSFNMAELVPILCEEVIPGDKWRINTETMLRMAPMVAPIMHRVNVTTHYFFVPNRLVWDNWENFITGGEDGKQEPVMPYRQYTTNHNGLLLDHLGYSRGATGQNARINVLPMRAYQMIYNEYYRDQNVQAKATIETGDGADATTDSGLKKRAWEKDYFTTAQTNTQRGDEVLLPLSGSAPVVLDAQGSLQKIKKWDETDYTTDENLAVKDQGDSSAYDLSGATSGNALLLDPNGTLEADLTNATATNIEELRRATRLQQWLEKSQRTGSRYVEQLAAFFGVVSSDGRLNRPEYLGGGRSPVVISEVLQTSETGTSPQGGMAGHGIAVGNTHRAEKYFEEHGYIIGIMSVMPKTNYYQGMRRHLMKDDKYDYYWPEFAQLGEQPVYQGELYSDGTNDKNTFGYQSRYAEYKYIPSSCHGEMKASLDFWTMARKFDAAPVLNSSFIEADPTHRIFADTNEANDKLYAAVYNNIKALRPIPRFNLPTL